jgi:hypothetical protein
MGPTVLILICGKWYNTLTTADAVNGIVPLALHAVTLPKDGDGPEFTRFTTGLKKFIANFANLSIQELGIKNSKTSLLTKDVAEKLGASFPYEQSDNLGGALYEAIKRI